MYPHLLDDFPLIFLVLHLFIHIPRSFIHTSNYDTFVLTRLCAIDALRSYKGKTSFVKQGTNVPGGTHTAVKVNGQVTVESKYTKQPNTRCKGVGLPEYPNLTLAQCKKKCDANKACGEIQVQKTKDTPGSTDVGCGVCLRTKGNWNTYYNDGWGNMYVKNMRKCFCETVSRRSSWFKTVVEYHNQGYV